MSNNPHAEYVFLSCVKAHLYDLSEKLELLTTLEYEDDAVIKGIRLSKKFVDETKKTLYRAIDDFIDEQYKEE